MHMRYLYLAKKYLNTFYSSLKLEKNVLFFDFSTWKIFFKARIFAYIISVIKNECRNAGIIVLRKLDHSLLLKGLRSRFDYIFFYELKYDIGYIYIYYHGRPRHRNPGGSASPATPSNNELLLPSAVPSYLQGLVSQSCCHSQLAELTNKVD